LPQQLLFSTPVTLTISGIHQMEFQQLIGSRGICIHYDVEDFEQDIQHLRDRNWL
ncbi:MAG: UPF0175 family protein, partial [Cyanobacteria bacterium]|nr:UPF0175 family protein [Cyanobacteriota bacterium]